jgi:hypothetical protein
MRTYLLEIKIEVRNVKTGSIVGSSRLYQDSLAAMGKTHNGIVREATKLLFEPSPQAEIRTAQRSPPLVK